MSAKNQLVAVLDFIGENEAVQILKYVRETFTLKPKLWEDIEEDDPLPDEVAIFDEYHAGKSL